MLRLAIIGTNWITHKFVEAALASGLYCLTAIYSRNQDNATDFAAKYPGVSSKILTDLSALATSDEIDVVYIASPNSLHAAQAILLMNHGKHVIVEKPMASNTEEALSMIKCAKENQVILFEAFKTQYTPNFHHLKSHLEEIGPIRIANFHFCQYSSRYPLYLAGELPNTFNPTFSNGSLMDIGFYCIATAVALWGKPKSVSGQAVKLASGVDAFGSVVLNYGDFIVSILHSKVSNSLLSSEIQGEEGNLTIEHLSECRKITQTMRIDNTVSVISETHPSNTMQFEAEHVAQLIHNRDISHQDINRALITMEILTELRKQIGVSFPADEL